MPVFWVDMSITRFKISNCIKSLSAVVQSLLRLGFWTNFNFKLTVRRMQYESAGTHVYFPGRSTPFVLVLCFPEHCLLYKTDVNGWHAEVASYSEMNMVLPEPRADLWKAFIQTMTSWIDAHLQYGQHVMHHSI